MKQIIPTFSKVKTQKIYFNEYNIKQKEKNVKVLTDGDFIDGITQRDIDCERRNELPYGIDAFFKKKCKAKQRKFNSDLTKRPRTKSRKIFITHKGQTERQVEVKSNEDIIKLYQDYLDNNQNYHTLSNISNANCLKSINNDSNVDNKKLIKNKLNRYKIKAKKNNFLTSSTMKSKSKVKSTLYITTTNFTKTKRNDSFSLLSFKNDSESLLSSSSDISTIYFPKANKRYDFSLSDNDQIRKKIKLLKLKDDIKSYEKVVSNQLYNKEKLEEDSKLNEPFIRNGFYKTSFTKVFTKKPQPIGVESKVKEYINKDTINHPLSCKKRFNQFDKVFIQASQNRIRRVDNKQLANLEEIEYKPPDKDNWIQLIERGFKDEIVNYQGKLGIFIYAGLQGYFTKHFGDITEGEKAYKEAMRRIKSDWSSKKIKRVSKM